MGMGKTNAIFLPSAARIAVTALSSPNLPFHYIKEGLLSGTDLTAHWGSVRTAVS